MGDFDHGDIVRGILSGRDIVLKPSPLTLPSLIFPNTPYHRLPFSYLTVHHLPFLNLSIYHLSFHRLTFILSRGNLNHLVVNIVVVIISNC